MIVDELITGPLSTHEGETQVNHAVWIVSMFLLGIAALGLCFLFMRVCEKI